MVQEPFTVGVAPGEGLVARSGDVIAFVGTNDDDAAAMLAAAAIQPVDEKRLKRLAKGAFGLVAPTKDGFLVLLHGRATVDIETGDGRRSRSGGDGWTRTLVPAETSKISIGVKAPTPRTNLVAGVVAGGGFVVALPVVARTVLAPKSAPDPTTVKIPSVADVDTEVMVAVGRAPTTKETAAVPAASGVLTAADGALYPLDRPYVIGRAPLNDAAVRDGTASPIVVPYDPSVSRVHAYVTVERDRVFVRDASTSGTFVARPGADEWTPIGGASTRLEPGWSVRVGDWIATLHA